MITSRTGPCTTSFSPTFRLPPAQGSRYFPQKGNVVLRSGWGEEDAILLFRAGPNYNHNHADQGSFLLRAFGENLVREAGAANYYLDPYYDSYFKQAVGHNTLLVDHDPASQEVADTPRFPALNQYPRITDVILSPRVGAASCELQQVYRHRLRSYHRRILMAGSEYIVVCDDVAANRTPAQFDWLLHLPDVARVRIEGETASYAGPKATLVVRAMLPAGASLQVRSGHIPYSMFNPSAPAEAPENPAILELGTKQAAAQVRFLVLLAPSRTAAAARAFVSTAQAIDEAGWSGFVAGGDREDLVLFRKGAGGVETTYGVWSTDAAAWLSRREGGRDMLLAAQSVTALTRAGRILFGSDKPVSFAADYQPGHIAVTVHARQPARVKIARPDGTVAESEVAAGQKNLTIRW
jgi:hypothetical protein